jgi:hypothetical protein
MRLLMIVIFVFLCVGAPLLAQDTTPLGAPLLAVNTAAQDHILLYDVTAQTSRSLSFGDGWHIVWGFAEGGCRIVYTLSDGPDFARAYSARLDGSDVRELVQYNDSPTGEWGVWEPQPSPDGSRIAFTLIERTERILPDGTRDLQHRIGWVGPEGGTPQFYSVTGDECPRRGHLFDRRAAAGGTGWHIDSRGRSVGSERRRHNQVSADQLSDRQPAWAALESRRPVD